MLDIDRMPSPTEASTEDALAVTVMAWMHIATGLITGVNPDEVAAKIVHLLQASENVLNEYKKEMELKNAGPSSSMLN